MTRTGGAGMTWRLARRCGFDAAADGDGSGCVNLADLSVLLAEYGVGC